MANKNRWFIPTNTDNLKMIIAQGLISAPDGFKKYYSDVLELFPGYVPLFRNRIQPDILKSVTNEVEGLTPCILELELKNIGGIVKTFNSGQVEDKSLEEAEQSNSDLLLLPTPIPLYYISKVIFNSDANIKAFENDAKLYSNVPITTLKLHYTKTDQKLFEVKPEITDYPVDKYKNIVINKINDIDYNVVYAFGGMLANLFYYAKNGKISNELFLSCCLDKEISDGSDISNMVNYFYSGSEDIENNNPLYYGIVNIAIKSQDVKEGIIEFLESNPKTVKIAEKLKTFEAISDKPVSQEFSEAKTLLGKVLLMLFHRENTEVLMEYSLDIFTETDYLAFATIFGIRDKFIKVPKFLREFNGLQNFISVKMANYAHEILGSQLKFKEPKQPLTIIDMLKNDRFKAYLAKELKIEDCFETTVPKSDYRVVKGKPIFEGIVMPKFKMLEDKYFKSISTQMLTEYNKYLDRYNKVK